MVNGKNTYYVEDTTKTTAGERYVPMSNDVEQAFRNIIKKRPHFDKEIVVKSLDKKMSVSDFFSLIRTEISRSHSTGKIIQMGVCRNLIEFTKMS